MNMFWFILSLTLLFQPGSTTTISITPDTVSVLSPCLPSIQCTPGSLKVLSVLVLKIYRGGESVPMATVHQHDIVNILTTLPVKANGVIQDGELASGSFLNVTFNHLCPHMTGPYICEMTYIDDVGNVKTSSDKANMTVMSQGIDTFRDAFKDLMVRFEQQEATLKSLKNQQNSINSLKQNQANQTNSLEQVVNMITTIEKNQQNEMTSLKQNLANQTNSLERSLEKNQQDLIDRINSIAQSLTNRVTSLEAHHPVCPDSSWTQVDKLCYKAYPTQRLYWSDALNYCRTRKGTLVQIDNQEMNAMVAGLLTGHGNDWYWIGANDINHEGHFEWVASSTRQTAVPITQTSYQNWGTGEPNDIGGGEDCVYMSSYSSYNGKWGDAGCNGYKRPFVCQTNAIYLQHQSETSPIQ